MKTNLFFLLLLLMVSWSSQAQMVMGYESFDNPTFVPTGWSIKPAITPQNLWTRRTTSTFPTANPQAGAGFARFASRNVVSGTKQLLISRALDYTNRGSDPANVNFWMYRDDINANYDSITVWVNSTDTLSATAVMLGTITRNRSIAIPDTQAVNGWYAYSFAIPTSFTGNVTTRIIFEGTSETPTAGQGAHQYIDNISFEEYPAQCTGIPNVGNIINPLPLICGGSGTANLQVATPLLNVAGVTYTWQEASSPLGPWTNFGTNAPNVTTNTLSTNTYFQCLVNCSFSGLNYTTPIDSILISANPAPTVSINPSPATYCAGSAGVSLTATGGVTYAWSPATGLNSVISNNVIASPAANTSYTVLGTDSNGCVGSATVNVTVGTGPTIGITATPSDSICSGGTIILNSLPGGGAPGNTYLWSDGVQTRRDTVIVTSNMTLSVIVTNQAGCSSYDTINLYALPAQNSNFGWTQNGNTFSFIDSTAGSTAWSWNFGDGNMSTNQNPTYTFSGYGVFTVTFIVDGPCKTDTITKIIELYPAGILDINSAKLVTCYPNPTSSNLHVELNGFTTKQLSIINVLGQSVKEIKLNQASETLDISVQEIPKGIYTLLVNKGDQVIPIKFIKQ